MSSKQRRKPKARPPRRELAKPVRKRKPSEEKKDAIVSAPERKPERKAAEPIKEKTLFLAVRLLGPFAVPEDIEYTLTSLKLKRRFTAALMEKNESTLGMLRHVKDYITWGDVGSSSLTCLLRDRGFVGSVHLTDKLVKEKFGLESLEQLAQAITRGQISLETLKRQGVQPIFNLHPPSGGFESSIKRPLGGRGELGYRGDRIGQLISQMM